MFPFLNQKRSLFKLRNIFFRLHCGDRAVCGSRHNLTEALNADVSGGKYARDIGVHVVVGLNIAVLHVYHTLKQLASGIVADKSEQTEHSVIRIRFNVSQLSGLCIADGHAAQNTVAVKLVYNGVPHKVKLRILERLLLDGLGGTKLVSSVDNGHLSWSDT